MPLVRLKTPLPIQGVSQQPDELRLRANLAASQNSWPSPVEGLVKRQPTIHLGQLSTSRYRDALIHGIQRDERERYAVLLSHDTCKVFDVGSATERSVIRVDNQVAETISLDDGWTKGDGGLILQPDAGEDPEGGIRATRVGGVKTAGAYVSYTVAKTLLTDEAEYIFRCRFKNDGGAAEVILRVQYNSTIHGDDHFVAVGMTTATVASSQNALRTSVQELGNSWYEITMAFTFDIDDVVGTDVYWNIFVDTDDGFATVSPGGHAFLWKPEAFRPIGASFPYLDFEQPNNVADPKGFTAAGGWTLSAVALAPVVTTIVGPYGYDVWQRIGCGLHASDPAMYSQVVGEFFSGRQVLSCYFQNEDIANDASGIALAFQDGGNVYSAAFAISTAGVITTGALHADVRAAGVIDHGGGAYQCYVVFDPADASATAAGAARSIDVRVTGPNPSANRTVLAWGALVENGKELPSPYADPRTFGAITTIADTSYISCARQTPAMTADTSADLTNDTEAFVFVRQSAYDSLYRIKLRHGKDNFVAELTTWDGQTSPEALHNTWEVTIDDIAGDLARTWTLTINSAAHIVRESQIFNPTASSVAYALAQVAQDPDAVLPYSIEAFGNKIVITALKAGDDLVAVTCEDDGAGVAHVEETVEGVADDTFPEIGTQAIASELAAQLNAAPNTPSDIQTFTGNNTWTAPAGVFEATVLVVGGGGGGAANAYNGGGTDYRGVGGGGGGGLCFGTIPVVPGVGYTVTVGAGGGAGAVGAISESGSVGGNSVFGPISALGGGGGGGRQSGGAALGASAGGSGGGAGSDAGAGAGTQADSGGATGYGNNGGASQGSSTFSGGGGGGAGAVGGFVTGTHAGAGGVGISSTLLVDANGVYLSDMLDSDTDYAGGGGATSRARLPGPAGDSSGGAGNNTSASPGTANTGGGGGATLATTPGVAGNGGSGVVIVAWSTAPGVEAVAVNSVIRIAISDGDTIDDLHVEDSDGNNNMLRMWRNVQFFDELPLTCRDGFRLRITGDEDTAVDDYFVVFDTDNAQISSNASAIDFSNGVWRESLDGEIQTTLDTATMPQKLVRRQDDSAGVITGESFGLYFTFEPVTWRDRKVGDSVTNPLPTFVGEPIRDVFFWKSRLGFLAGTSVIMSEASQFDMVNFFRTTVRNLVDTDLIDLGSAAPEVANFNRAQASAARLNIFADRQIFSLTGTPLSPATAELVPALRYESTRRCPPTHTGRSVLFASPNADFQLVREILELNDNIVDIAETTASVPKYITGEGLSLHASDLHMSAFLLAEGDRSTLWVYNWFWQGNQKVQNAWHKWDFGADARLLGAFILIDNLYIIQEHTDGAWLTCMELGDGLVDSGSTFVTRLDRKLDSDAQELTENYSAPNTFITLPYTTSATEKYEVVSKAGVVLGQAGQGFRNLMSSTEDFVDPGTDWALAGDLTGAANSDVAPDGTTTADTITSDTGSPFTDNVVQDVVLTPTLAENYTHSIHIKEETADDAQMVLYLIADSVVTEQVTIRLDLELGTVSLFASTTTGGSGYVESGVTVEATNGYWRVGFTLTDYAGTADMWRVRYYPHVQGSGEPSRSLVLWGAQLELGGRVTPYEPVRGLRTTGATQQLVIPGDHTGTDYWVGQSYKQAATFTRPVAKRRSLQGGDDFQAEGRLQLRHALITYTDTRELESLVTKEDRPDDRKRLQNATETYGDFRVALLGKSRRTTLSVENPSPFPSAILGVEWSADYRPKGRLFR